MEPLRRISRQHLVMTFIAVFLAVQLVVPAVGLLGPRPGRFSWQMYSGTQTPASFEAVHLDGTIEPVNVADYLIQPRLEMNLLEWVPQHLCSIDDTLAAVRVIHLQAPEEDVACVR